MEFKSQVDVSAFILVESSGDSEEDYDDSAISIDCDSFALAEDDAESCCCGMSSDVACMDDCIVSDVIQDYGQVEDGKHEDEHDIQRLSDGNWTWHEIRLRNRAYQECNQTEETKQVKVGKHVGDGVVLSEEENNRNFWNACLAL